MGQKHQRNDVTFVVRIWNEPGDVDVWRAAVTDVSTTDRRYFTDYEELVAFVERARLMPTPERRPSTAAGPQSSPRR